ncbi:MAG: SGNH/GDSL hydrolase family protein [Kiritimatiellia bacterium]|nr:SGNH/GDSL hydrolase family protein [Kiritimatiellia bacterium]MDP6811425.1 SGNH/GDSL hydrolase family protein [Kiritimatiellia bacterium]MDP7023339.1 SGNH/GDSL hydrolase family protein [Kiritimatiellia bacterium]
MPARLIVSAGFSRLLHQWWRLMLTVSLAVLVVLPSGCNDDDDEPVVFIADTHDFGGNDRRLVVVMGDSITTGIDVTPYPEMLASLLNTGVVNEGFSGEHAYEGVRRVNAVLARYRPGYLFMLYGANDILHFAGADDIAEDLRTMVRAAKAVATIPIIATLTPMARARGIFDSATKDTNHFIRAMAAEEGVLVVDLEVVFNGFDNDADPYVMEADDLLQWDGLHPNETGNWEIALAFADMLNSVTREFLLGQP